MVDAIAEGGIRALEVTMTVPGAIELIAGLAPKMPPGFLLGAGTVLDAATALKVIDAGAQFIVSPVFRREVIAACHSRDVAVTPGCFTPTEILEAWDAGADIVKVFPATALGPGYIKDVRAPLPQVKLMPTGGVTLDNAGDWIRSRRRGGRRRQRADRRQGDRGRQFRRAARERRAHRRERRAPRGRHESTDSHA